MIGKEKKDTSRRRGRESQVCSLISPGRSADQQLNVRETHDLTIGCLPKCRKQMAFHVCGDPNALKFRLDAELREKRWITEQIVLKIRRAHLTFSQTLILETLNNRKGTSPNQVEHRTIRVRPFSLSATIERTHRRI